MAEPLTDAHQELRERLAEALSATCGRCDGKGTERHQIDRDPAAGYEEWPCPSCSGGGVLASHRLPDQHADRVLALLDEPTLHGLLGLRQVGWTHAWEDGGTGAIYEDRDPDHPRPLTAPEGARIAFVYVKEAPCG